jgi:integrase
MLYSGMRREEMLGLRWEDIDFEKCIIHVERTITYPSSKPVIGLPKTPKSERDVPVPDELIDILRPHKKPEGFLMSNENGELYNDYQIKKLRSAAREYSGLPELDARQLRHSFASLLHAAGVETRAVGACMGHTKSSTTDRYIQVENSYLNDIRNTGFDYAVT